MNWLTNFVKPKLSAFVRKKEVPENLWNNCPKCGNMIHHKDLKENLRVCISCNYHFRMSAEDRINILFVNEELNEIICLEDDVIHKWYFENKQSESMVNNRVSRYLKDFRL